MRVKTGAHSLILRQRVRPPLCLGYVISRPSVDELYYLCYHQDYSLWEVFFLTYGNTNHPHTVESITCGERLIFTADDTLVC